MKKILLGLILLFLNFNSANAENLSFVYINGSNNNNLKMKTWYEDGIKKLHPVLVKRFEKSKKLKKYYSCFNNSQILKDPVIFFWGYESRADLRYVLSQIDLTKKISAPGAYFSKKFITENFHDAIWIQKPHNLIPVTESLNNTIKNEARKNNNVVLYGYSAGAFVAYQYMFNKFPYINFENLLQIFDADEDLINYVKKNPVKNTCISALSSDYADILVRDASDNYLLRYESDILKNKYMKLDEMTERACAPDNIAGTVYFASPLPLFYSDLFDSQYNLNYFNSLLIKYILEKNMFLITVNFKEDPMGFATSRNLKINDIEKHLHSDTVGTRGVIYNGSEIAAKRFFFFAHTSYWSARKSFAKSVVRTLEKGFEFLYKDDSKS